MFVKSMKMTSGISTVSLLKFYIKFVFSKKFLFRSSHLRGNLWQWLLSIQRHVLSDWMWKPSMQLLTCSTRASGFWTNWRLLRDRKIFLWLYWSGDCMVLASNFIVYSVELFLKSRAYYLTVRVCVQFIYVLCFFIVKLCIVHIYFWKYYFSFHACKKNVYYL